MPNLNKVHLMGNITREIELRYTPKGTAVADIGLAINRRIKHEGQEATEETTFVDVTLWGRTAEVVHEYSGKGEPIYIEGRLQMDTWVDKETGGNRSKLKIVADSMQLLTFKQNKNTEPEQPAQPQGNQHQAGGHPLPQQGVKLKDVNQPQNISGAGERLEDSDIPF
jgi:single-strand DNA-binding protein